MPQQSLVSYGHYTSWLMPDFENNLGWKCLVEEICLKILFFLSLHLHKLICYYWTKLQKFLVHIHFTFQPFLQKCKVLIVILWIWQRIIWSPQYCCIPVTFNTSFTPKAIQVLFFEGFLPDSPLEYHPSSTITPAHGIDRNNFQPCSNNRLLELIP